MSNVVRSRLLLCGGIGSGKSEVAGMLARRGITVIHADGIGHAVLEPEGEAFRDVAERWPPTVVDGHIDRGRLASVVFGDPTELRMLESITHPHIRARIERILEGVEPGAPVVVELPLLADLLGPGWARAVVDAPDHVRLERLRARGMDDAGIKARMAAQPGREAWLAAADVVVDNRGTPAELEREVDRLVRWMAGPIPG